jgi:hypothetical protein
MSSGYKPVQADVSQLTFRRSPSPLFSADWSLIHTGFLLGLLFVPGDVGDSFFRIIGFHET